VLAAGFYGSSKSNYDIAIKDLVYRPGVSPLELITQKPL
jgi:phytoene desaturase